MKKLYLEVIDELYDPKVDYTLGPWCFIGAENLYPEWENIEFIEPFENIKSLSEAELFTRNLANQYAIKLTTTLNAQHSRNFSVEYWRSMLILWLIALIQALWRRYKHIENFVQVYKGENLNVHIYNGPKHENIDSLNEFMDLLLYSSSFDFWISSLLIEKLAPDNWSLTPISSSLDKKKVMMKK